MPLEMPNAKQGLYRSLPRHPPPQSASQGQGNWTDTLAQANKKLNDYYSDMQAQQQAQQQAADPFMDFLLNQLGIAGLNQQPQLSAENQHRMRFGREPLPQLQPPPPPTLFDTTLNQLRGVDSLLAQLLSGIQPQPARPAPPALLQPIPQQSLPAPATPEPPSLHDIWQVLWDSGMYGAKNAQPGWNLPTYATDPRESFRRFVQKFSSDPSFAQTWMNNYLGLLNGDIQIAHIPGGS